MGIFRRRKDVPVAEARTFESDLMAAALRGGSGSAAGQFVTLDRARQLAPVWRCQHLIADLVSSLPMCAYRTRSGRTVELDTLPSFVGKPSQMLTGREWRYALLLDVVSHGNALAVVTGTGADGWTSSAETVGWRDVEVKQSDGALSPPTYLVNRREVDIDRVMHLRAFGPEAGTVLGLSPLAAARETIGLGLAVREFGANWYASGGHPTTALTTTQSINAEQAMDAKSRFRDATRGDHIAVLGNGWDMKSVQIAPDDALFLAATQATAVDICGFYGVPPEMVGYGLQGAATMTYTNAEQRSIDLLKYTMRGYVSALEEFISAQLPAGQFVKANVDDLLRTDAATRWAIHERAMRLGVRTRNEILEEEDESPLPVDGNEYLWPPVFGAAKTDGGAA